MKRKAVSPARVLIVDDERQMRLAMGETLRRAGYDTSEASSGKEAAALFAAGGFESGGLGYSHAGDGRHHAAVAPQGGRRRRAGGDGHGVRDDRGRGGGDEARSRGSICSSLSAPITSRRLLARLLGKTGISGEERYRIVTEDAQMKRLLAFMRKTAASDATVLIQAESGTGKELAARFIHANSPRAGREFVAVNCAAVPENLLESEAVRLREGGLHRRRQR